MPPDAAMGDAAAAPAGSPTPAAAAKAASRAGARAAFAASFRKSDTLEDAPAPDVKPAAAPVVEADEPDADEADEAEDADDAPAPEVKPEPPAVDQAALAKLAASQKEERARKDRAAAERAAAAKERADAEAIRKEVEAQRKAMEADRAVIEEARRLKTLRERAKVDPDAAIELLGLDAGAYDELTRLAYSQTEAGAKDPKAKEHAARLMRERAARGEVGGVKSEQAEMRKLIEEQKAELANLRAEMSGGSVVTEYLDSVEESFGEAHPVVGRALTAARAKASDRAATKEERQEAKRNLKALRDEFATVASDLYQRDKVAPEPEEVAAEVEARRAAELRRWGYDPTAIAQPAAPKKPTRPPPTVLSPTGASPTQPARKLTPDERRAEFVRKREAGKLGD